MSKPVKAKSSLLMTLAALIMLASLLYGQEGERGERRQERERIENSQEGNRERREVREVRGIVREVDLDRRRMVVDLSGEDSARLNGRTEATVEIDKDTEVKNENNTRGSIFSIERGASVSVKLSDRIDASTAADRVEADRVKLEIACKATQGCPQSGGCGNDCGSNVCACPKPKQTNSERPPRDP